MKAMDMTPIIRKYPGLFVAMSRDHKTVFGTGHDPATALKEAMQRGVRDPILARIPEDNRSYLL